MIFFTIPSSAGIVAFVWFFLAVGKLIEGLIKMSMIGEIIEAGAKVVGVERAFIWIRWNFLHWFL